MNEYTLWQYGVCHLTCITSFSFTSRGISHMWWFLVFAVSPRLPSVAMAAEVCSDQGRLPGWFTAGCSAWNFSAHSGCLEQESSQATGHTKNTVQMAAAWQLATHPGPAWFTGADIANLFHFIISKDISPVIPSLPICSLSYGGQEGCTNYLLFPAGKLFSLKSYNRKNVTKSKRDVLSDISQIFWVTLAKFSVMKLSYSSEYD